MTEEQAYRLNHVLLKQDNASYTMSSVMLVLSTYLLKSTSTPFGTMVYFNILGHK